MTLALGCTGLSITPWQLWLRASAIIMLHKMPTLLRDDLPANLLLPHLLPRLLDLVLGQGKWITPSRHTRHPHHTPTPQANLLLLPYSLTALLARLLNLVLGLKVRAYTHFSCHSPICTTLPTSSLSS